MVANVFSSSAKFLILQLLCSSKSPISLRQISRICDLPVRSAQLALDSLEVQSVITSMKEGNQRKFILCPESEFSESVKAVFFSLQKLSIARSKKSQVRNGDAILAFINQAKSIAPKVKGAKK